MSEIPDILEGATTAQADAVLKLLSTMGSSQIRVRSVVEFDGQVGAPVALEVVGGVRFLIDADGSVTEYPRDDG